MKTQELKTAHTYAVVLGLSTNGLGNVRALAQYGIPVIIFLSDHESHEVYAATRYGQKHVVNVTDGAAILEHLRSLPQDRAYIVYPTTDYQVGFLSEHRRELPANCTLQFPDAQVVEMLLHKDRFDPFCRAHNFPVPAVAMIHNAEELAQAGQTLTFPVIAKTSVKVYKPGLQKAYILANQDELRTWYVSVQSIHPEFLLQEFIPGTDHEVFFTMQYIAANGTLLASFTGRKIRQWHPLSGGTASAEPAYNEDLTRLTYDFFKQAGFFGVGSMEYKLDPRTEKFYMIEPTVCRTDFQEGVAIANGVNIPLIAYQDLTGQAVQPVFQKPAANKVWMHVLNDRLARDWYLSRKQLSYLAWLRSLRHVRAFDAFSWRDPGPLLATVRDKLRHYLPFLFRK